MLALSETWDLSTRGEAMLVGRHGVTSKWIGVGGGDLNATAPESSTQVSPADKRFIRIKCAASGTEIDHKLTHPNLPSRSLPHHPIPLAKVLLSPHHKAVPGCPEIVCVLLC